MNQDSLQLLHAIEFKPEQPLEQVLKDCKLSIRSPRYHLKSLVEQKILQGYAAYVNTNLLNLTSYGIYFSLTSGDEAEHKKLLQKIHTLPRISWLAALGGNFQYVINIRAKHISEVLPTLELLTVNFPDLEMSNSVAIRLGLYLYSRANSSSKKHSEISIDPLKASIELDYTDEKVLEALSQVNHDSMRQRALKAGISPATFFRRREKLEEQGVITGYAYSVDASLLGLQSFRILITFKTLITQHRKDLRNFASQTPEVRKLVECLGAWSAELEIEVKDLKAVAKVQNKLRRKFGKNLEAIEIIPLFGHLFYRSYL